MEGVIKTLEEMIEIYREAYQCEEDSALDYIKMDTQEIQRELEDRGIDCQFGR